MERRLCDLTTGQSAEVLRVGGESMLHKRLLEMGLTPRTRVTLRRVAPMGDPMEIVLRGYALTLRREDAARIIVHPEKA